MPATFVMKLRVFLFYLTIIRYRAKDQIAPIGGKEVATKSSTRSRTSSRIKEPKQYNVIMHNDDFTTMDFVVEILVDIFHKDEVSAQAIMLNVHKKGHAAVGKYPYDIAVSKVSLALERAKNQGFPFRMTVEEA